MKILGFDIFSKAEQPTNVVTKKPAFNVMNFTSNNPFTSLVPEEFNYYDQYILYTARAIDYIGNKIASAPIHLYTTDLETIKDNELAFQDLEHFNPYMNLWEARKLVIMHKYLVGAAYWYIDRDPKEGKRIELYPLDPTKIRLKTDSTGMPAYYSYYDANGRVVELPMEDVVAFKNMNPRNWFEGISTTKMMSFVLNAYAQGAQYNMNKLGNNTNVDKFLFFDGISEDEKLAVETQLRNKYGGVKNAGRTGVVTSKPEVIDVSSGQKELDYVEGMKMMRQDILAMFGIPEALLFPSATNSNTKEAIALFQRDTLEPLLQQEKAVLNEQYLKKFDLSIGSKTNFIFNFDEVVEKDKEILTKQATELFKSTLYTRNQSLVLIGDEPLKDLKLGDAYYTEQKEAPVEDQEEMEEVKVSKSALSTIESFINEKKRKDFIEKNIKLAEDQEGVMYQSSLSLFETQLRDTVTYLNKADKPGVRGIFNTKEQIDNTKQIFKDSYAKVISNSNDVGNVEIKSALFETNNKGFATYRAKALSMGAIEEIAKHLDIFATELSETTRDKLRKAIVVGTEAGFDKTQFVDTITKLFNEFADGQGNIDTLSKNGFYIEAFKVDGDNVTATSAARYKQMFGNIISSWSNGDLTTTQRDEALKALRGLIDPSNALGSDIDMLLTSYGVPKNKEITRSRAVTIARTEATFGRNLGFDDTYNDNPFVKGKKWNSLHDKDVRDSHANADGQIADKDGLFQLESGKAKFPGDGSHGAGPEDIVNCRCRITAVVI